MALLAIIIVAAAAAETAVGGAPDVAGSGWISGDTLTTLISILAGAGGVVGGKMWGEKSAKKVRAEIPQPLAVELKETFVSRREFDQHCQASDSALKAHISDNERNFEALYNQMRANDKLTAKISGCLEAIQGDLSLIKTKLFGGKK